MWNIPTREQLARIPKLGGQSDVQTREVMIYLHFFVGACDWFIGEHDGDDIFYGFGCLGYPEFAEWGTISFRELKEINLRGFEVDCEVFWPPEKFSEIERVRYILDAAH